MLQSVCNFFWLSPNDSRNRDYIDDDVDGGYIGLEEFGNLLCKRVLAGNNNDFKSSSLNCITMDEVLLRSRYERECGLKFLMSGSNERNDNKSRTKMLAYIQRKVGMNKDENPKGVQTTNSSGWLGIDWNFPSLLKKLVWANTGKESDQANKSADVTQENYFESNKSLDGLADHEESFNQLIPEFDQVVKTCSGRIARSLLCPVSSSWGERPEIWELSKISSNQKCEKAVVIGVHGYILAAIVRKVMGQPTGTSEKLNSMAASSVYKWCREHDNEKVAIEKIALSANGKIDNRVGLMWNQLQEYQFSIREADAVFIATHSQGVVVSTHLLQQLLACGWIKASAKVGLCALAGTNLGPMSWISGKYLMKAYSALESQGLRELFELQRETSEVFCKYKQSLRYCLRDPRVRFTHIGSIDDQLVPMYSSLFINLLHPHVLRGVFLDYRYYKRNFLADMVELSCLLAAKGISDHNLLLSLSQALAGSFYKGEGHSKIYEDPIVFDYAVRHMFETAPLGVFEPRIEPLNTQVIQNPYYLPWAMYSIFQDPIIKKTFAKNLDRLKVDFLTLQPTTKIAKDIYFRLAGLHQL